MRYTLGTVLAVLACSLVVVSSASAVTSTWLVDGAVPAAQVETNAVGVFFFEDTKGGPGGEAIQVTCEALEAGNQGFVGPGGEDLIAKLEVVKCLFVTGKSGPCETSMEPTAVADNLPWLTLIELLGGKYYDNIVTEATGQTEIGWLVTCLVLGLNITDLCSLVLARAELKNEAGGLVDQLFNSADPNQPAANCTRGGAGTGLLDALLFVLADNGLPVAVSEG
jgi:hypothetical protein